MGFIPITIDKYIKKHLENNPSAKEVELRKGLNFAIDAYNKGIGFARHEAPGDLLMVCWILLQKDSSCLPEYGYVLYFQPIKT
jgi:hypothetical protein